MSKRIGVISLADILGSMAEGADEEKGDGLTDVTDCPLKGQDHIDALLAGVSKLRPEGERPDWKRGDLLRTFEGFQNLNRSGHSKKGPPIVFYRWLTDKEIADFYSRVELHSPGHPSHLTHNDCLGGWLDKNSSFNVGIFASELMEKVDA